MKELDSKETNMNKRKKEMIHKSYLVMSICLLVAFCALPAIAEEEEATISGEIEVADYSEEDGSVTAVSVFDVEWGDVLISNEGKGRELLNHVGAETTIVGRIFDLDDDSGYLYEIRVSSYVIDEPADLDEDSSPREDE
jgi:hypothetical protein